jgi:predicted MPP superfamily phosphohydrolase
MKLTRRRLLVGLGGGVATGALGGPAGWAYARELEPRWLEVRSLTVALPRLPAQLAGLRIAQISDLHFGHLVPAARVRAAVDAVLRLRPNLAVVTGDFVSQLRSGEAGQVVVELSRLAAPLGVYGVLGNHDHWTEAETVAAAVRRAGVGLLRNSHTAVRVGGATLYLAGVDDVWERKHDLAAALRGIPAGAATVLLAHEPDFADAAARDRRVGLQLSGHSHGGQVRVPGLGALILPPHGQKYPDGLRRVGDLQVYTNRGIGVIGPGVRLNCRPEVTMIELTALT